MLLELMFTSSTLVGKSFVSHIFMPQVFMPQVFMPQSFQFTITTIYLIAIPMSRNIFKLIFHNFLSFSICVSYISLISLLLFYIP